MAYRMTRLSDSTRVGVMRDGRINVEVYDDQGNMDEIFIPAKDVKKLREFIDLLDR